MWKEIHERGKRPQKETYIMPKEAHMCAYIPEPICSACTPIAYAKRDLPLRKEACL